ncbi:hypothetical protein AK812_SmicGene6415 [Symbiodinium microadriaticum]|uniref:Ubiquitin-like protease family profile domain-containing protein n=1 Tax=Symbiodinium microadriaticum TaxID=2951 RepID=A0A1Q9ERB7_SYMMI|nr:hypothetical protein AK812_SmicGene6415 [Symbiodinium microadriaticum]
MPGGRFLHDTYLTTYTTTLNYTYRNGYWKHKDNDGISYVGGRSQDDGPLGTRNAHSPMWALTRLSEYALRAPTVWLNPIPIEKGLNKLSQHVSDANPFDCHREDDSDDARSTSEAQGMRVSRFSNRSSRPASRHHIPHVQDLPGSRRNRISFRGPRPSDHLRDSSPPIRPSPTRPTKRIASVLGDQEGKGKRSAHSTELSRQVWAFEVSRSQSGGSGGHCYAAMPVAAELTFRRALGLALVEKMSKHLEAMINIADAGRLGEGEDLNDALLDFFMRLGQYLIPKGGEDEAQGPVSYLGAIFFKQLRRCSRRFLQVKLAALGASLLCQATLTTLASAFSNSGEEGWKNAWPAFAAFAVPINEVATVMTVVLRQDAGNHWWLAPFSNASDARKVMCLDSMQRREKILDPPLTGSLKSSINRYTITVKKHLGLGPELPTKAGEYDGTLSFSLDGRVRSSSFVLHYGETGYSPITLQFDPFALTKLQKDVSRFVGGYLAKEWEVNGPDRKKRYEKTSARVLSFLETGKEVVGLATSNNGLLGCGLVSVMRLRFAFEKWVSAPMLPARALVADVHQQENLNDCGVFVLENMLRSLSMKKDFLKQMSSATPQVRCSRHVGNFIRGALCEMSRYIQLASCFFFFFLGPAHGASNCAKMAGCWNLQGGDQLRPILDGEQQFLDDNRACAFGHVAKGLECKTGPSCGYTWYECICISEGPSMKSLIQVQRAIPCDRIAFGAAAAGIAFSIWICVGVVKMTRGADSAKIVPSGFGPGARSLGAASQNRFSAICVEQGQGPVVVDDVVAKQPAKSWDCLTVLVLGVLPAVLIIAGIAIMVAGMTINEKGYFNGCRI